MLVAHRQRRRLPRDDDGAVGADLHALVTNLLVGQVCIVLALDDKVSDESLVRRARGALVDVRLQVQDVVGVDRVTRLEARERLGDDLLLEGLVRAGEAVPRVLDGYRSARDDPAAALVDVEVAGRDEDAADVVSGVDHLCVGEVPDDLVPDFAVGCGCVAHAVAGGVGTGHVAVVVDLLDDDVHGRHGILAAKVEDDRLTRALDDGKVLVQVVERIGVQVDSHVIGVGAEIDRLEFGKCRGRVVGKPLRHLQGVGDHNLHAVLNLVLVAQDSVAVVGGHDLVGILLGYVEVGLLVARMEALGLVGAVGIVVGGEISDDVRDNDVARPGAKVVAAAGILVGDVRLLHGDVGKGLLVVHVLVCRDSVVDGPVHNLGEAHSVKAVGQVGKVQLRGHRVGCVRDVYQACRLTIDEAEEVAPVLRVARHVHPEGLVVGQLGQLPVVCRIGEDELVGALGDVFYGALHHLAVGEGQLLAVARCALDDVAVCIDRPEVGVGVLAPERHALGIRQPVEVERHVDRAAAVVECDDREAVDLKGQAVDTRGDGRVNGFGHDIPRADAGCVLGAVKPPAHALLERQVHDVELVGLGHAQLVGQLRVPEPQA